MTIGDGLSGLCLLYTSYCEGLRGFIPASKLALEYVEDVEEYVGKTLSVIVITADREANKLVLSAKDVEKERAAKEQEKKLNALQKGFVTEGVIERIEPYGCFVTIGDGSVSYTHLVLSVPKAVEEKMDKLRVADAITEVFRLFKRCNKYIDETEPWVLGKDEAKKDRLSTVLYNLVESIVIGASLLEPFMPETTEKILAQLNAKKRGYEEMDTFGQYESCLLYTS